MTCTQACEVHLHMQVEDDLNFEVILQFLASFAGELPLPCEVKAGHLSIHVSFAQTPHGSLHMVACTPHMQIQHCWRCIASSWAGCAQLVQPSLQAEPMD